MIHFVKLGICNLSMSCNQFDNASSNTGILQLKAIWRKFSQLSIYALQCDRR